MQVNRFHEPMRLTQCPVCLRRNPLYEMSYKVNGITRHDKPLSICDECAPRGHYVCREPFEDHALECETCSSKWKQRWKDSDGNVTEGGDANMWSCPKKFDEMLTSNETLKRKLDQIEQMLEKLDKKTANSAELENDEEEEDNDNANPPAAKKRKKTKKRKVTKDKQIQ